MTDHVLPWPDPDWDNPEPYNGPSDDDRDTFRVLQATVVGVQKWVTYAYANGVTDTAWLSLGARLIADGQRCIDMTRTVKGEIEEP